MTRFRRWKDRPQAGEVTPNAASVIIVPGVSADALDKQTCYHFEELMKNWCAAPNVWVYDHGVHLDTPQSWNPFCDCGEDLLSELLSLIEQQPQLEFVLIGHRLGAFILKKALLLAYRQKHHEQYISLFEALRTLIMIGEPYLDSEDRTQWSSLVQDSLESTKGSLPETFSVEALTCLKFIEEKFEQLQINSQFFQVSGKPSKRKGLHRTRLKAKNCVCDGSVNVRMWTTQDDETVIEGIETSDKCIFSTKGGSHGTLSLITAGQWGRELLPAIEEDVPLEVTDDVSTGPEPTRNQAAVCHQIHHADVTLTAPSGLSVLPEVVGQAIDEHISIESDNHVDEGQHNTENDSASVSVNPNAVKACLAASSSVESDCDMVGSHKDPLSESEDQHTSNVEDVDQDTEVPSFLSRRTTSQSKTGENRSSPGISHRVSVEVPNTARQRSRPLPLRLSLPPTCRIYFPQVDATTWLESLLCQESSSQGNQELKSNATPVAVLHGMGGVGKTQIALNFVRSVQSRFDAIVWLNAGSKQSILQGFHDAAIALRLINGRRDYSHAPSAGLCMEWLARPDTRWLLIFDNADEAEIIAPYISASKNGATIITTRDPELKLPDAISSAYYHVQPLSVSDSQRFLLQSTHLRPEDVNSEPGLELSEKLSGLPLALTQTANFIEREHLGIEEYLSQWKEVERREPASKYDASYSLAGVWSVIVKTLSPDARKLLAILSYMNPDATRTPLVQAMFEKTLSLEDPAIVDDRFSAAANQLTKSGLIDNVTNDDAFRIHSVTQAMTYMELSKDERRHTLKSLTSVLGAQWPSDRKFRNILHGYWAKFDDLIDQYQHVFDRISPVDLLGGVVDKSFPRAALCCVWYNRRIRGNKTAFASLAHFATAAVALPGQHLEDSTSSAPRKSYMPKRLVMIDHERQTWRLIDTAGKNLRYMALSLGFNDDEGGPTLTKSNLRMFQSGRALADMSVLFLDCCASSAMAQTKYLWIDTLCIDQDNDEETASQICRMDEIYQSAIATILPRSELQLQQGQVKWGRYEFMCKETSTVDQFRLLQASFTKTDRLDSLKSVFSAEFLSNIRSYVQDVANDPSDDGLFSDSHITTSLAALLEGRFESSNVVNHTSTEETLSSEGQSEVANRVTNAIATAKLRINEAIQHYAQGDALRAVTKLVQVRELVRTTRISSSEASRVDLQAAIYLARIFLIGSSAEPAMDLLNNIEVPEEIGESRESESAIIMAQLRIVKGDAYIASGRAADASNTYRENIDAIDEDQEGEIADLAAISKLRLSNCHMAQSNWKGAHALIKEVIAHFEEQDSKQGQAQYARVLCHQAALYKEEKKEKFRKRSMAAARQALEELCEEHDLDMPATNRELERDDFETVIELGFL